MENEQIKVKKRKSSSRQKVVNAINPLKHGKTSKYFNTEVAKFIKDPKLLADILMDSIKKLEKSDLDTKERILYTNTLTNVYKTIFGNKNLNLNVEVTKEELDKQVIEIVGKIRDGSGI